MTPILVTGGTGNLGRAVVAELAQRTDQPVTVLSRHPGPDRIVGDLVTGHVPHLSGVDTIVHLATTLRGPHDVTATRNLIAAATGVRHLVFVSIVGIEHIPIGYYKGKLAAEELVRAVPHTILRATQFHELILRILAGAAKLPLTAVPSLCAQPVDVRDVAAHLVTLAQGPPRGRVPDFGGPDVHTFRELATEYLRATNRRRVLVPVHLPGKAFRGYRECANLVPPGNPAGRITFAEFLAGAS